MQCYTFFVEKLKKSNKSSCLKNKMINSTSVDNFNMKSVSPSTLQINQLLRLTPATPIFNPRYSFYSPNEIICNENSFQTVCNPLQQQGQQHKTDREHHGPTGSRTCIKHECWAWERGAGRKAARHCGGQFGQALAEQLGVVVPAFAIALAFNACAGCGF